MSIEYSTSEPPGQRVKKILVGGDPLQPDKEYLLATTNFLVNGGDGMCQAVFKNKLLCALIR